MLQTISWLLISISHNRQKEPRRENTIVTWKMECMWPFMTRYICDWLGILNILDEITSLPARRISRSNRTQALELTLERLTFWYVMLGTTHLVCLLSGI